MTQNAPGWPGIAPKWTSSAKAGVGTALNSASRVWFTISHGILDEIYYPRVDIACTRDMGLIVTDGHEFFSEEKRNTDHTVSYLAEGVPGYRLINTCKEGRFVIEKEVITHSEADAVLQRIRFKSLTGESDVYHLYVIIAPHLGNHGSGNNAWIGSHKGAEMLFAEAQGYALAVACSAPWLKRSAGFVGVSDGWQDLVLHKQMTWGYEQAENGNVALTGEIDLKAGKEFMLVVGFGADHVEAGHRALNVIQQNFDAVRDQYVREWQDWQGKLYPCNDLPVSVHDLYRISTCVMHCHEAKAFLGAIIASLSIPWGYAKGDEDLGGYHLVWPRDLVETAIGLVSVGADSVADRVLKYLRATQDPDGKWPQNMWVAGTPYWSGVQMDETAFPILLFDHARRKGVLRPGEKIQDFWPMVRKAAIYLLRNGPVTMEDRWETDPGYSPFTLAIEIAALLAAADMADMVAEPAAASYMRDTADTWNSNIERWTYVTGTELDRKAGVEGHYLRIGSPGGLEEPLQEEPTPFQKRAPGTSTTPEAFIIGTEPLAFVRFGLRHPKDERILNTVKVIDAVLKKDTPYGPAWRRYLGDEYGEHEDGSPFDGTGIGRAWPLLTGERAHYELAAGNRAEAERLLRAMEAFANEGGMIPEQIWDAEDIPEKELFSGRPSGSAMPLVWAHAEYVKLRRSLDEGCVYDTPPQTVQRYLVEKRPSPHVAWRFNNKCVSIQAGKILRLEFPAQARVKWGLRQLADHP